VNSELLGDAGAVNDKRFGELILHLDQFPHGAVGQAQRP
jgi:hypothetical protein